MTDVVEGILGIGSGGFTQVNLATSYVECLPSVALWTLSTRLTACNACTSECSGANGAVTQTDRLLYLEYSLNADSISIWLAAPATGSSLSPWTLHPYRNRRLIQGLAHGSRHPDSQSKSQQKTSGPRTRCFELVIGSITSQVSL